MTPAVDSPVASGRAGDTAHQKAWYWYDWANSAYVTTTLTVLMAPYLTVIAKKSACPTLPSDVACPTNLSVVGIPVAPGSLVFYVLTFSTIVSAIVLIFIGAIADRSPRPVRLFAGFAWAGAAAASAMFLVSGDNWALGVLLLIFANLCLGSSLVIYDSLLCRIASPDERDRVSSRGWAWGYLGGGLLLALNLALLTLAGQIGISAGMAVRISLLSAGLWWATFTIIPVVGLRDLRGATDATEQTVSWAATETTTVRGPGVISAVSVPSVISGSLRQLTGTFRELRLYPQTMLFLLAYLFFNDGIQTVISASSVYGAEELNFSNSQLIEIILLVQFVAFGGALLFGRLARRFGAWRVVLSSLGLWTLVVTIAFFVPTGGFLIFVGLAVLIGIVLGGSQALSRSMFSQLIPRGREAEFFSLYQAMERGTSWFGTLVFGLVHQFTDSYRWAIIALIVFFVVGGLLLSRVRMREGIIAAGNEVPAVI
ncbi:MAG: MFS transporter [Dermatophilaceae bacterium]|nr:MFS transporter [Dermatophilaceae bacterium]